MLKRKYFSSRHIRVPNLGEVLYQENAGSAPIVAASYLRQFRDVTTQRVMLMGGGGGRNRVDMLDVMVKVKDDGEEEKGGGEEGEEVIKEHCWEVCPQLLHERTWFAVAWLRGEIFSIGSESGTGVGTVERPLTFLSFQIRRSTPRPVYKIGGKRE